MRRAPRVREPRGRAGLRLRRGRARRLPRALRHHHCARANTATARARAVHFAFRAAACERGLGTRLGARLFVHYYE